MRRYSKIVGSSRRNQGAGPLALIPKASEQASELLEVLLGGHHESLGIEQLAGCAVQLDAIGIDQRLSNQVAVLWRHAIVRRHQIRRDGFAARDDVYIRIAPTRPQRLVRIGIALVEVGVGGPHVHLAVEHGPGNAIVGAEKQVGAKRLVQVHTLRVEMGSNDQITTGALRIDPGCPNALEVIEGAQG